MQTGGALLCSRVQGPVSDMHLGASKPASGRLMAACCAVDTGSGLLWDTAKWLGTVHAFVIYYWGCARVT